MAFTRSHPEYGRGTHEIPGETPTLLDEEHKLVAWLDSFLTRRVADLPRPPQAALEILALSSSPTAKLEDITRLLEREPLLAGRVLKLANSALYGASTPVTTLKQALVRMGLSTVRDVVLEAAFHLTVLRAEGFEDTLERIRRHSTAVAWLSRFVARNTPIDAENAFLIGLLHDVGLSVGLIGLTEYLKAQRTPVKLTPLRWLAVDSVHERFADRILASWGMAPQVRLVCANHHSLTIDGRNHPSVAILMIAEHIAEGAGWGVEPVLHTTPDDMAAVAARGYSNPDDLEKALAVVSLTPGHYKQLVTDTKKVLDTLAGQFKELRAA